MEGIGIRTGRTVVFRFGGPQGESMFRAGYEYNGTGEVDLLAAEISDPVVDSWTHPEPPAISVIYRYPTSGLSQREDDASERDERAP